MEEAASLVPARSRSGPLADVSNSVYGAGSRALSGEISLVEAPSGKGHTMKKQPSQSLPALESRRSHVLLDMDEAAVPGVASEVALGVRTAAVTGPASLSPSSPARTARDRASGAAGDTRAKAEGDGFEDLDLQENRIERSSSMIDPGGGGGSQQPPSTAAAQRTPPIAASEQAVEDELRRSQSSAASGSDDGKELGFSAELESLRRAVDSRPEQAFGTDAYCALRKSLLAQVVGHAGGLSVSRGEHW